VGLALAALVLAACGASPGGPAASDASAPAADAALAFEDAALAAECDASAPPADAAAPGADAGPTSLKVLFIGNSYTYVNDLPGMLSRIAATAGAPPAIATEEVVQGSATLGDHWANGIAQQRIDEGQFTHVVLQGQSLEAAYPTAGYFTASALDFGRRIVDAGATPVLYVTWARASGDPVYAGSFGGFVSPDEMQDFVSYNYAQVGGQLPGSLLACVGEAFRAALRDHPGIVLHQADRSHPTVAGTYLAASTLYVALTGNPVPAASEVPAGVGAEDARLLRDEALVGTDCADVRPKGAVTWQFCTQDCRFDFGVMGTPIAQTFYLNNSGFSAVGLAEGPALAPPFEWTSGAYPGGTGNESVSGLPFCTDSLAPGSTCVLSVKYSGTAEGQGAAGVRLTGDYRAELAMALHGAPTTRALLTVSDDSGFFGRTDASSSEPATLSAWPGRSALLSFVVSNRGALATQALGEGTPLSAPFSWGPEGGDGAFPGGSGTGVVEGVSYEYCSSATLAAGQQCVATVRFTAPETGTEFEGAIDLAYSDAAGPVTPNAGRKLRGWVSNLPP
jgi:hypothetical protein